MKEIRNENMLIKIISIILGIASLFLLIMNFLPIFVINAGLSSDFSGDHYRDAGVYVNESNPDFNYIESYGLAIGESCETYLNFNLESLPKETEELYFFINGYVFIDHFAASDVEINIILVNSSWDASTITWNNKPKHEEIIDTVNISDIIHDYFLESYNLKRAVNLMQIFKQEQLSEISICLNITENNELLDSNVYLDEPFILWRYRKVFLSYTTIISTSIIITFLIGTTYFLRKDIFICKKCGSKRILDDIFCRSCGTPINENIITKGLDYQLLLITLWIFTFFELSFLMIIVPYYILGPFSFIVIPIILILWIIFCYRQIKKRILLYKRSKFNLKQIKR